METITPQPQAAAPAATTSVPATESNHKNIYGIAGAVVGVLLVVGIFVGGYFWLESMHTTKVNEITAEKALLEQQASSTKANLANEKQRSEKLLKEVLALTPINPTEEELLAMFKRMIVYKHNVSATSTIALNVIKNTESKDSYQIGVGVNCKEGGTEEENQGCSGIEKFYKRKDGTWMIVGFNDICPVDAESEALCARAGF